MGLAQPKAFCKAMCVSRESKGGTNGFSVKEQISQVEGRAIPAWRKIGKDCCFVIICSCPMERGRVERVTNVDPEVGNLILILSA